MSQARRTSALNRRFLALLTAAALLFLVAGCSPAATSDAPSPIGFWGSEEAEEPNLSFSTDSVSGTDGCNRLSGSWSQDDSGRITFDQMATTQIQCDGVDAWLNELSTAVINDREMQIFNASGTEIGTLAKN